MAKALAALGMAMIATMTALTIAFGTGQQAHADNKFRRRRRYSHAVGCADHD